MQGEKSERQTYVYFSVLTLFMYLIAPTSYMVDITTTYMLKDQLHASATDVSTFRLWTAFPVYVAFLFGFVRDRWSPFGMRDRGYFILFGALTGASFLAMAFMKLSYASLFIGLFAVIFFYRFIASAFQGLMALIGQEKLMSGRMSTVWNIVWSTTVAGGSVASGWMAVHLTPQHSLLIFATMAAAIAVVGFWKPKSVFSGTYDQPPAKPASLWTDVKRLATHRPIYPAVLVIFMFQFAPGANTPLQYYLTDHLHASDAIYADFQAIFSMAFVPVFFLYGWLCKRVAFGRLLVWGTIITIPQMIPLAFINSAESALWLAGLIGALGGIFAAAMFDLAFRSCPPGLQGTMMMLVEAGNLLSTRGGDLLGSWIYKSSPTHGFQYCVIAITITYALILPVILTIPKHILATRDGEAFAQVV